MEKGTWMVKTSMMKMKRDGDAIGVPQWMTDGVVSAVPMPQASHLNERIVGIRPVTLSRDNPTDPPRIEVPSLVVLAAKQVAAHILDQENLKLAPLHANLIHGMGIKREKEKGKSEWSPTPVQ